MTSEMMPCECGRNADLLTTRPMDQDDQVWWQQVVCPYCLRAGPRVKSRPEAIAAWNTRTPAPAGELAALAKKLEG